MLLSDKDVEKTKEKREGVTLVRWGIGWKNWLADFDALLADREGLIKGVQKQHTENLLAYIELTKNYLREFIKAQDRIRELEYRLEHKGPTAEIIADERRHYENCIAELEAAEERNETLVKSYNNYSNHGANVRQELREHVKALREALEKIDKATGFGCAKTISFEQVIRNVSEIAKAALAETEVEGKKQELEWVVTGVEDCGKVRRSLAPVRKAKEDHHER